MFFRDIPGQGPIKEYLKKSVRDSRVSHALMFHGPDGSGKLALALAFARYISCTSRDNEDACGTCPSCIKFSKLAHPDLHFVFPSTTSEKKDEPSADNLLEKWRESVIENPFMDQYQWYEKIGLENKQGIIRTKESSEIIRKLNLKSYEALYKILIMWLPERMHNTTANKLLKIIEEPPPFTLFLLVSESVSEVLPTIRSRSQLIKVPRLRDEDIRSALELKYGADDPMINDAVKLADGNINKALGFILKDEQNTYNFDQFVKLMRACYSQHIPGINDWVEEMAKNGREKQKLFLSYALRMLRENLLLNTGTGSISHMSGYESDFSLKFFPFISRKNITGLFNEFNLAHNHISANGYARIVFFDLGLKVERLIRNA